jgi:hypothetical protein
METFLDFVTSCLISSTAGRTVAAALTDGWLAELADCFGLLLVHAIVVETRAATAPSTTRRVRTEEAMCVLDFIVSPPWCCPHEVHRACQAPDD